MEPIIDIISFPLKVGAETMKETKSWKQRLFLVPFLIAFIILVYLVARIFV